MFKLSLLNQRVGLFGKLNLGIAISVVLFFYLFTWLKNITESQLSYVSEKHQSELLEYAEQAKLLLLQEDNQAIEEWQEELRKKENTYVDVVSLSVSKPIDSQWSNMPDDTTYLGRPIFKPIHLGHRKNPLMDIPLDINNYHLLIRLPQRMRPGILWDEIYLAGSLLLTVVFALALSFILYRYIVAPLRVLESVTHSYGQGKFERKLLSIIAKRNDEIADLARSFDHMGCQLEAAHERQRQLIQDISHELRTPLTRIQLSLEGKQPDIIIDRVSTEIYGMKRLVEGILTLASIDNGVKPETSDEVEVSALIEIIVEDAQFEFPSHELHSQIESATVVHNTNHIALSQTFENVIRNACKYSPEGESVVVHLWQENGQCCIDICDRGQGVNTDDLTEIFEPFVRVDRGRANHCQQHENGGYGIGLALCKRQIQACNGKIFAKNNVYGGLTVSIRLPLQ